MMSQVCGRCGVVAHMDPVTGVLNLPDEVRGGRFELTFSCANCRRLNLASMLDDDYHVESVYYGQREEADDFDWSEAEWLPRHREIRDFPDVPQHIAQAASEATLCLSVGAFRAVGALTRAVIEAVAKEKGITSGKLFTKIEALHDQGLIRAHVKEAAHEVRYFGNDMAHGDFVEPASSEEAAEAIELMSEVLNEVFQSVAKVERVRQARLAKRATP